MNDQIPISALQHYRYCPRQCALIHVEQTYHENLFTLRGNRVHEKVHQPDREMMAGVRLERALPLFSDALGLVGEADVVEFLSDGTPYPVEYKSGARKEREADDVQLCAQAMCLEEMFDRHVSEGSIYYDRSRRRRVVELDEALRELVQETVQAVRGLYQLSKLPDPVADERCRACSLIDACMPYEINEWNSRSSDPFTVGDVE